MKQTAVEWMSENLKGHITEGILEEVTIQAKQMEKEQITAAYRVGKVEANLPPEKLTTGEQYYNETYGKDERAKNESLF